MHKYSKLQHLMASKFKLTSMEIASLTLLVVVVAIFGIALLLNRGRSDSSDAVRHADSLATVIEQRTKVNSDSITVAKKRNTTKGPKKQKQSTTPISRDYLDEKAND